MVWKQLNDAEEWKHILSQSFERPQVVFKHSTRCSISSLAKTRLEKTFSYTHPFYLLDLLQYRPISNQIAEDLKVTHESPQVLVIKDGACIYYESHTAIDYDEIIAAMN